MMQIRMQRSRERGFTLVELMIAVVIGLFLTGGLVMMMQSNRRAFTSQNQMSVVQDNERMAMNLITDIVQQAGYYPDPTVNTQSSTMPSITTPQTLAAGQWMNGSTSGANTISVRFAAKPNDGVLNCAGTGNTTGAIAAYVNKFSVSGGYLICNMNGTDYKLVGATPDTVNGGVASVSSMTVLYGISSTGSNNVDVYLNGAGVNGAAAWNKVVSVRISLVFANPLYNPSKPPGPGVPATLTLSRTIGVMNQVGL